VILCGLAQIGSSVGYKKSVALFGLTGAGFCAENFLTPTCHASRHRSVTN
jgi:hypothetical protein